MTRHLAAALLPLLVATAACAGGDAPEESAPASAPPAAPAAAERPLPEAPPGAVVRIASPADGAEVQGPQVTVVLETQNLPIVPAADTTPGTGHHHLFLDDDVSAPGQVIPTIEGRVVHMGTGVSEYTFENVAPGEHRLIAVVADWMHVPLMPWVVDTIRFTVR